MNYFLLLSLVFLSSCRTLGGLSGFSGFSGGGSSKKSYLNPTRREKILIGLISVIPEKVETKGCESLGAVLEEGDSSHQGRSNAFKSMKHQVAEKGGDSLKYTDVKSPGIFKTKLYRGEAFRCKKEKIDVSEIIYKQDKLHINGDFDLFFGSYFHREGILRELGKAGATFGISYSQYASPKEGKIPFVGFFVLWTFDHFKETNSKLLKPKFFNENYTNYLLGGGISLRWIPYRFLQFHYKGGLAVNFIEIDTFGGGDAQKDQEYSDFTLSTIHKIGFDLASSKLKRDSTDPRIRIGPNLFYYFAPDPLGKFSKDDKRFQTGNSWAWSIDIKIEMH